MPLPSNPPSGTLPPGFKTWGDNVADTAADHETRLDTAEGSIASLPATFVALDLDGGDAASTFSAEVDGGDAEGVFV
jgi:hypothetical protein